MKRYQSWSSEAVAYKINVHEDLLGSGTYYTRQNNGYTLNKHEYDAYGFNTKAPTYNYDPEYRATEPYFTGHPYDGALNLYYAHNRFYDAQTGRWLSEDTIEDGLNWYAYCNNNPVSYVDVLGLSVEYPESGYYYIMEGSKAAEAPDPLKKYQEFPWNLSLYAAQKTIQGIGAGMSYVHGLSAGRMNNLVDAISHPINDLLLTPLNFFMGNDIRFPDYRDTVDQHAEMTFNKTAFYAGTVTADFEGIIGGMAFTYISGTAVTETAKGYAGAVLGTDGIALAVSPQAVGLVAVETAVMVWSIKTTLSSTENLHEDLGGLTESRGTGSNKTSHMLGENGTQFANKTTWQNGKTERLDVENPAPGERPGQIHYHDAQNNKWMYDIEKEYFYDQDTGELAPNSIQKLLQDSTFKNALKKALRYLGEK